MGDVVVAVDDPRREDVRALLETHLRQAYELSPPEHVHALDVERLVEPDVTFFSARRDDGTLVGVGALKELSATHGEIKSMHTAGRERDRGVGRAVLDHLLAVAVTRGYERVSLETGPADTYAAAHALYTGAGFTRCDPFGDYTDNPFSVCMTRSI